MSDGEPGGIRPTSAFHPLIRSWATGTSAPPAAPRAGDWTDVGTEVWLLSRAASGLCDLAARQSGRPSDAVALQVARASGAEHRMPDIEQMALVLLASDGGGVEVDTLGIGQVERRLSALIGCILGAAALLACDDGTKAALLIDRVFDVAAEPVTARARGRRESWP